MSIKVTEKGVNGSFGFETEAIQGLVDNAEDGEEIIFPAVKDGDNKEYQIDGPIYLKKNVTIKGETPKTRIVQRSSSPIFIVQPLSESTVVNIENFELRGGTNSILVSSSLELSPNSEFKNLYINGHSNAGIFVNTPSTTIKITNAYISGGAYGIYATASAEFLNFSVKESTIMGATTVGYLFAKNTSEPGSGSLSLKNTNLLLNNVALSIKDAVVSGSFVSFVGNDGQINLIGSGAFSVNNSTSSVITSVPSRVQEVTVAQADADFSSLSAACASIVDSSPTKPYLINVYPGIYVENPFTVPQNVAVNGQAATSVVVFAADNNSPLMTLTNSCQIQNITLNGPTANVGIDCQNIKGLLFENVIISDAQTGFRFSGSHPDGSSMGSVNDCFIVKGAPGNTNTGVLCENGSFGNLIGITVSGAINDGILVRGTGSRWLGTGLNILHCGNGIGVADEGQLRLRDSTVRFSNVGLIASKDGTQGNIFGSSLIVQECGLDYVQSGSGEIDLIGAVFDSGDLTRRDFAISSTVSFLNHKNGEEGFEFRGKVIVGSPEYGRETVMGEGDSYTRGVVILTSDNTAGPSSDGANFIDVSLSASTLYDGLSFTFQGTGSNHAIYVGSSLTSSNTQEVLKHWGVKVQLDVPRSGGLYRSEYWNGSTWDSLALMQNQSNFPYEVTGSGNILEKTGSFQIRYGLLENTNWTKKVINDQNLYWARLRIISSSNQTPVFDQIKLHSSRTEVNPDGVIEKFGLARTEKELIWHHNLTDGLLGSAPGDADIDIANGFSLSLIDNSLAANTTDGKGGIALIGENIDTSLPFRFRLGYILATAGSGDVIWEFKYRVFGGGDTLNTSQTVAETQVVTASFSTGEANILRFQDFTGSFDGAVPGDSFLGISFARRGGDAADTKAGNVNIVLEELFAYDWR